MLLRHALAVDLFLLPACVSVCHAVPAAAAVCIALLAALVWHTGVL